MAEFLSRNPKHNADQRYSSPTERYIQSIITKYIPNALEPDEIARQQVKIQH